MDRILTIPTPAVRLHAWYRSAGSLLRELSRALNQGQTLLRADSGLPVGTHLVLVMAAERLSTPLEVQGTVTSSQIRGGQHEMTLRYDFDPGAQRGALNDHCGATRAASRSASATISSSSTSPRSQKPGSPMSRPVCATTSRGDCDPPASSIAR